MGTTPISIATPQPQPESAEYSLDAINLFEIYTAATIPPGAPNLNDPTQPTKEWWDSNQANQPEGWQAIYETLKTTLDVQTGVEQLDLPPTFVQQIMPSTQAAALNIFLPPSYPPYVPAPTPAQIVGTLGPISGVNPYLLSTLAQATELNELLGGKGVLSYQPAGGPDNFTIDYNGDTRQQYYFIDSNGQLQWVGYLVWAQTANGVGAPGNWVNVAQANGQVNVWTWVPSPISLGPAANTPVVPVPMRQLYSPTNPPPAGEAYESFSEPQIGQPLILRGVVPA
jgi:hypothetical protein